MILEGKRLIAAISDIKREVSGDQWSVFESDIESGLSAHLDIHCNYWMKRRFIELESYLKKRRCETCMRFETSWTEMSLFVDSVSVWHLIIHSVEYSYEYPVPESVESNPMMRSYVDKIIESCLAIDDYYMCVSKLMTNDITSRVFSYANHHKCSVQEAIDNQFDYCTKLYTECQQMKDQLIASAEGDNQFGQYVVALLGTPEMVFSFIYSICKLRVESDQTISSERWTQLYDDLIN